MSDKDTSSADEYTFGNQVDDSRPPSAANIQASEEVSGASVGIVSIGQGTAQRDRSDAQADPKENLTNQGYFLRSRVIGFHENREGIDENNFGNQEPGPVRQAAAARPTGASNNNLRRGGMEGANDPRNHFTSRAYESASLTFDPELVTVGGSRLGHYDLIRSDAERQETMDRSDTYSLHVDSRPRVGGNKKDDSETVSPPRLRPVDSQWQLSARSNEPPERVRHPKFVDCAVDDGQQAYVCRPMDLPDRNRRPDVTPRSIFVNDRQAEVSSGRIEEKHPCAKGDRATVLVVK